MDLMKLGKKSILVPTPGQAEQEYLAAHLHEQQLAYTVSQAQFSLKKALANARAFSYQQIETEMEEYKKVIRDMIGNLRRVDGASQ
jgi:UDP-N-acetylglucosamine:LPS N-acetylglucosamine transferase